MDCKEIRKKILDLAVECENSHIASALSMVEILVALYDTVMKSEDKFILSKGHGCLGLYVVLREKGFNPTILGHPDIEVSQGVECTTGSLGHGLPIAVGMALAKKLKGEKGIIYVLMGDGECQEGTTWESAILASNLGLDNLKIIIDCNKLQSLREIDDNLGNKFFSFGCGVLYVNGHDIKDVIGSFEYGIVSKPIVIIANTIKGKGIGFMENRPEYHAKQLSGEQIEQAYRELS